VPEELTLAAEFPTPTRDEWMALVSKVLRGSSFEKKLVHITADGIRLEPLATREQLSVGAAEPGLPGVAPFTRGASPTAPPGGLWDVRSPMVAPDPAVASEVALADLTGGSSSLSLRFDRAFRRGVGPGGDGFDDLGAVDGVCVHSAADLDRALDGVLLDIAPVVLQPGAGFTVAAAWWREVLISRGVDTASVDGCLGADPIGTLAAEGILAQGLDRALIELGLLAAGTAVSSPEVRTAMIDAGPWVEAGATPVQQLAAVLSTGVAYLRAMEVAGLDLSAAARSIEITLVLDADVFEGIALLRAVRRLWSAVLSSCGVDEVAPLVGVRTAERMMTSVDPWVNLLRVTSATFAAAVGGASSIVTLPFDSEVGFPAELGRRMARNTQLVLALEAHVADVVDPAGGSFHLETLTDQFVDFGWRAFTLMEGRGGIAAMLLDGSFAGQLAASAEARRAAVATRRRPITGVTEFPMLDDVPLVRPEPDRSSTRARATGETSHVRSSSPTRIDPLVAHRDSEEIEAVRAAAEAAVPRPSVFLANLGPIAAHTARSMWAKNFFEVGGVGTIGNDGFSTAEEVAHAFVLSGSPMACLCSNDAVYTELAVAAASALRAAGARRVFLAGAPGDLASEVEAAGVDAFVHVGVDLVEVLSGIVGGGSFQ